MERFCAFQVTFCAILGIFCVILETFCVLRLVEFFEPLWIFCAFHGTFSIFRKTFCVFQQTFCEIQERLCIFQITNCAFQETFFALLKKDFVYFRRHLVQFLEKDFAHYRKDFVYFSKHFVYFWKHIFHLLATVLTCRRTKMAKIQTHRMTSEHQNLLNIGTFLCSFAKPISTNTFRNYNLGHYKLFWDIIQFLIKKTIPSMTHSSTHYAIKSTWPMWIMASFHNYGKETASHYSLFPKIRL